MHQIIYNLAPSVEQAYVYLLIGKACHCMDVRVRIFLALNLKGEEPDLLKWKG